MADGAPKAEKEKSGTVEVALITCDPEDVTYNLDLLNGCIFFVTINDVVFWKQENFV